MLSFQCSLTCGKGVRTRAVKCVKDDSSRQEVAESQCPAGSKPEATEACVTAVCSPEISRWPPEFAGCRYCLWLWEGSVAVGRECACSHLYFIIFCFVCVQGVFVFVGGRREGSALD